jgi:DSF synthase
MSRNVAVLEKAVYINYETPTEPQIKTHYDGKIKTGWFLMKGAPRPSFTPNLLKEISLYFDDVTREMKETDNDKYDFLVLGSDVEGVFNLGGDLKLFSQYIKSSDRQGLTNYAIQSINLVYRNLTHLKTELTTVSLVQGDALGGGFESAISANVVIAERGVKMGLPETLFNLFPGMGAYSLLSRKFGGSAAEKMILSGNLYLSDELYDMGVVDVIAEKGEGELAVYKYITNANRSQNTFSSMRQVKDICNQINYEEFEKIALLWVESALKLTSKDLKMMERLVRRQNLRVGS